jgi:hypothetical protein
MMVPLFPTAGTSSDQSIWAGNLRTSEVGELTGSEVLESPFCHYEAATQRKIIAPLGDFTPAELFSYTTNNELGEKCIIKNSQGIFTKNGLETLYSKGSNNNFHSFQLSGHIEYLPAPGGEHVLSAYPTSPGGSSVSLTLYRNWRDTTNLVRSGQRYYMKNSSPFVSLTYYDGSQYIIQKGALAFSQNGKYMVVSQGSYIEKINLGTLEMTPVAYATSPQSTRLAISNDGRYVSYGKNTYVHVVDTEPCETTYSYGDWRKVNSPVTVYPGCVIREHVQRLLFDEGHLQLINAYDFRRHYFSPAGDSLVIAAGHLPPGGSGYEWREYRITADDYVSAGKGYLALGDSFVSGEGDLQGGTWYEPGTDEQGDKDTFAGRNLCHLSRRSYPYLLATELGYHSSPGASPAADGLFHSVACSGAKIHNIIGGGKYGLVELDADEAIFREADNQYRYFKNEQGIQAYLPGHRKQLDFFKAESLEFSQRKDIAPEVVTLSIGGNDIDFGGFMASCTMPFTCTKAVPQSEEAGWLGLLIADQKHRLVNTFKKVKEEAPDARVYVHGYPEFINDIEDSTGLGLGMELNACDGSVRLDLAERSAVLVGVRYLNSVIEASAKEAGVFYVDISQSLVGGRLCDRLEPGGERLFNGVTAGNDIDKYSLCSWRSGCLGSESFHPNPTAHERYASEIHSQTNGLTAPMPEPQKTPIPLPPDFFGEIAQTYVVNENALAHSSTVVIPQPKEFISYSESTADTLTIFYGELLQGSTLRVSIRSTPTDIGQFTVSDNGLISEQITLPAFIEPGSHTVYLEGIDQNGEEFIAYEPVFIAFSELDFDGDGIENDVDSCQTISNSGIDQDYDGIDDVCDQEILFSQDETEDQEEQSENAQQIVDDGSVPKGEVSQETVAGNEGAVVTVDEGSVGVLGASTEGQGIIASLANTGSKTQFLVGPVIVMIAVFLARKARLQGRRYRL